MKRPPWVPHPASWACAAALAGYAKGVAFAMALIVPLLFALLPHAPRLAWLGLLLVWIAPIGIAAAIHRATRGLLDFAEPGAKEDASPQASLWAGFVAWATVLFVTLVAGIAMLVIDPPPVEPDTAGALVAALARGPLGLVHAAVWIVAAAYVYELERSVRVA
jgi:hypothetical protein